MFNFLKTKPKGEHEWKKIMGPRIYPWGTPHVRGAEEETDYLRLTETLLPVRKDMHSHH